MLPLTYTTISQSFAQRLRSVLAHFHALLAMLSGLAIIFYFRLDTITVLSVAPKTEPQFLLPTRCTMYVSRLGI
jgi:hypothetical protein